MRTYKIETNQGTFRVESITKKDLPKKLDCSEHYSTFYQVRTPNGRVCFYLAKGHKEAPKQIVGWYAKSKQFHPSYGSSFQEIVDLLITEGWKYA